MALNLLPSKSQVGHPGLRVSGEWIQEVKGNPSLSLEYRHTQRVTPVIVDCSGSTRASAQHVADLDMLNETQEDGQPVFTFAGQEGFWNNKWRAHAIEEGQTSLCHKFCTWSDRKLLTFRASISWQRNWGAWKLMPTKGISYSEIQACRV